MIDQKSDKIEYKESNIQKNKLTNENVLTQNQETSSEQNQIPVVSSSIKYEQRLMENYLESSLSNPLSNNDLPHSSNPILFIPFPFPLISS
jgi:hypothetical protein